MSAAASSQHASSSTSTSAAPAAASPSASSSEIQSVTKTDKGTTLVSGKTINDAGEEEEFTIETIPLAQLSAGDTDKLASLASKVLRYFDEEAAERAEVATTAAKSADPADRQ
jgi:hypothetical protein